MSLRFQRSAIALGLLALGGCSAFRASAGVCLGVGGSVRAGPLDVGVLGGVSHEWGNAYGAVGSMTTGELGLVVARLDLLGDGDSLESITRDRRGFHAKGVRARAEGLVPDAVYPFVGDSNGVRSYLVNRPAEVAVSVYALFFSLHLGFDAEGFARDLVAFASVASGGDEPEPPRGTFADRAAPDDGLGEPPYRVVYPEDLPASEPETDAARAVARRRLEVLVEDRTALLAVPSAGDALVERAVGLSIAAADRGAIAPDVAQALGAWHADEARAAFEQAEASADPDALAEALASFPFADGRARAARVRAELLVERGEMSLAVQELTALTAASSGLEAGELERARKVLAQARELETLAGPEAPVGEAWSGSARLAGGFLGAAGRSVWVTTAGGDVAWESTDALPPELCARKVVGVQSELAVVEAIARDRAWVLGVDDSGRLEWRVPLPAASAGCGPMDQAVALGQGRVYVVRPDRVLAIEARSGRLLWSHARLEPRGKPPTRRQAKLRSEALPMSWVATEGPLRRRPDGPHGFRIQLTAGRLEITSGTGRPTEVLDPRTGEVLGE